MSHQQTHYHFLKSGPTKTTKHHKDNQLQSPELSSYIKKWTNKDNQTPQGQSVAKPRTL